MEIPQYSEYIAKMKIGHRKPYTLKRKVIKIKKYIEKYKIYSLKLINDIKQHFQNFKQGKHKVRNASKIKEKRKQSKEKKKIKQLD